MEKVEETPKSIAIFGGSFNPPHVAHVMCASWVLSTQPVDELLVIPTFEHPFGKDLAPYRHRVEMCRLAFRDLSRVTVSEIERELGGASYTVRTLSALRLQQPTAILSLVVGSDVPPQFGQWEDIERVRALASFIVVPRSGYSDDPFALPEVSSSEIREAVIRGELRKGIVPLAVEEYFAANRLWA